MEYTYDANRYRENFEKKFTWMEGFMRNVRRFADKTAMTDPLSGRSWTYKTLNAEACRLANALLDHGVRPGGAVLCQLMNSPEFAFLYLAPQKIGAVSCPANFNLSPGETARLIDHDRPAAYFYDWEYRDMAQKALELAEYKPALVVAADCLRQGGKAPEGHVFYDALVEKYPADEPDEALRGGIYSEVTRLYTSGTTGLPKGVPLNNANEVMSAHDVMMHFPLSPVDVTMNMTPWFHRGGLHSGGLTPTLYAGASCIVLRSFSAKTCLEWADKYGATFLVGVPSILGSLAARQEKHPEDLSRLRGIVTMGSPLERDACIRFQRLLTPNIFNGYGTTETFWNSFLRPYDLPEMAGSAGRACTDDEVRIVKAGENGQRAEPEDVVPADGASTGEIIIDAWAKSSLCYHDNPALTQEKYYKGWLYTGDLGTWDEKHYITVSGRKDDMIICKGENIFPAQIEEAINQHPKVAECIVTGVPDLVRGQAVTAYVVPADPSLTVAELNRFCAGHSDLSIYKCPRFYRFVESLPYTATGKKRHVEIRERAAADLAAGLLQRP